MTVFLVIKLHLVCEHKQVLISDKLLDCRIVCTVISLCRVALDKINVELARLVRGEVAPQDQVFFVQADEFLLIHVYEGSLPLLMRHERSIRPIFFKPKFFTGADMRVKNDIVPVNTSIRIQSPLVTSEAQ